MAEQLALALDVITVHCFTCPYTVEAGDPDRAHDAMERHYQTRHAALIARLTG